MSGLDRSLKAFDHAVQKILAPFFTACAAQTLIQDGPGSFAVVGNQSSAGRGRTSPPSPPRVCPKRVALLEDASRRFKWEIKITSRETSSYDSSSAAGPAARRRVRNSALGKRRGRSRSRCSFREACTVSERRSRERFVVAGIPRIYFAAARPKDKGVKKPPPFDADFRGA